MSRTRNNTRELVVLTILIAVAVSVVNAAVFVYYPINIQAAWSKRPVYFSTTNTNAGGPDIEGTITVTLSEEDTSATISVKPPRRGTTRYNDIMRIKNDDAQAYHVWIRVTGTTFNQGVITEAFLLVDTQQINLRQTDTTYIGLLNVGAELTVSLRLRISSNDPGSATASIELIYSPQTTSPPYPPPL